MRSSKSPSVQSSTVSQSSPVSVIVLAPSVLIRSFLPRLMSQRGSVSHPEEQLTAEEGELDIPQILVEPLSPRVLEELTRLVEANSPTPILVLCEADDFQALAALEEAAVQEYTGRGSGEELMDEVVRVLRKETTSRRPTAGQAPDTGATLESLLSSRELEVLERLAEGDSNREIAETLSISPNTVHTHVTRIQRKLKTGNRTRTALLARAMMPSRVFP